MKRIIFLILATLLLTGCDFLFSGGGEEDVYVVDVSIDSGVTVVPMKATAQKGESVTFTYSLKKGYVLSNVIANGVSITPSSNSFSIVVNASDQKVRVSTKEEEKQKFIISATTGDNNGKVSPSGTMSVTEGQNQEVSIIPNAGYMINTLKVGDDFVSPASSYTFLNVSADASLQATFKKDPILWPLLYIEWKEDSTYIEENVWYMSDGEILNFSSDGKSTALWNGKIYHADWSLDKSKSPIIFNYGGRPCLIEKINEEKFIFSYINESKRKVTTVYTNHRYK